jgi:hypothetical protein
MRDDVFVGMFFFARSVCGFLVLKGTLFLLHVVYGKISKKEFATDKERICDPGPLRQTQEKV